MAGTSQTKKNPKPYKDFPLTLHRGSGQWCKKIRGKIFYFGNDPDLALKKYLDQRDDLQAGRKPGLQRDTTRTVKDAVNHFLTFKQALVDSNELSPRTFDEYHRGCEAIIDHFGPDRPIDDLIPADFTGFRSHLAKGKGVHALGKSVRITRMVFLHAQDQALTDKVVRFGTGFKQPTKKTLRLSRQEKRRLHGERMLNAVDLKRILGKANVHVHAMILLGINCGFGQTDCAKLTRSAIDFDGGWIEHPRPKTSMERRCPLWNETIDSLRRSLEHRTKHLRDEDSDIVFLTRKGNLWVRSVHREKDDGGKTLVTFDRVANEFDKILRSLSLKRRGLNFNALRRTFETIGGESRDQVAVNAIMGHVHPSMGALYREQISDDRLQAVVDHVHDWLWAQE